MSSAGSPASPAQCHWLACLFYAQLPLTASSTATLPASLFQKNCLGPRPPFSGHTFHFHSTQAYARHSFSTYPANTHAYVCIHMYTHCIHTHFHPYSTTHSTHTHTHAHIARSQHPCILAPTSSTPGRHQASCSFCL